MEYSYSRCDVNCRAAWYMHYELKKEQEENAYGVAGSFLHEIMENHAKGKIGRDEAEAIFKEEWWVFKPRFGLFKGYDLNETYFKKISTFFARKELLKGNTINIEREVKFTLPSGVSIKGFIDREATLDGKYEIQDYKVSNPTSKGWNTEKKKRQLYLYAEGIKQTEGFYPDRMRFIFFQYPEKDVVIDFKEEELVEAIEWAENQISDLNWRLTATKRLRAKGLFLPNYSERIDVKTGKRDMFCSSICGYRNNCPFVDGEYLKYYETPKNQEFEIK